MLLELHRMGKRTASDYSNTQCLQYQGVLACHVARITDRICRRRATEVYPGHPRRMVALQRFAEQYNSRPTQHTEIGYIRRQRHVQKDTREALGTERVRPQNGGDAHIGSRTRRAGGNRAQHRLWHRGDTCPSAPWVHGATQAGHRKRYTSNYRHRKAHLRH
jgi:hypothetical protein